MRPMRMHAIPHGRDNSLAVVPCDDRRPIIWKNPCVRFQWLKVFGIRRGSSRIRRKCFVHGRCAKQGLDATEILDNFEGEADGSPHGWNAGVGRLVLRRSCLSCTPPTRWIKCQERNRRKRRHGKTRALSRARAPRRTSNTKKQHA